MSEFVLSSESVEAIAQRVAELLSTPAPASGLLTAAELAEHLAVDVKSVYRHADELGAVRVGRRLRFDLERALAAWPTQTGSREPSERSQPPGTPAVMGGIAPRRRKSTTAHCQLLPVGRREAPGEAA